MPHALAQGLELITASGVSALGAGSVRGVRLHGHAIVASTLRVKEIDAPAVGGVARRIICGLGWAAVAGVYRASTERAYRARPFGWYLGKNPSVML